MSDNLENNINDLAERISLLDTGVMFPYIPLGRALRRGASRRPKQDQPCVQPGPDQTAATPSGRQRDSSATKPRQQRDGSAIEARQDRDCSEIKPRRQRVKRTSMIK
jgi:hypothetical protein